MCIDVSHVPLISWQSEVASLYCSWDNLSPSLMPQWSDGKD